MVASVLEAVPGLERPVGAQAQQEPAAAQASSLAPSAPGAAGGGYQPRISFPQRRGPGGEQLSALPRTAAPTGGAAAATPPPPRALQAPLRVTVVTGAPPLPRTAMSDHEMEMIMLGGAEP